MKLPFTLILSLTAVGCAAPMPRGYVEVERPRDYEWRGMSSDGVVIGLRERWNAPEGPLTFWTAVVPFFINFSTFVDKASIPGWTAFTRARERTAISSSLRSALTS